jgi:KaiC/GvpD/RAD55 family RecA-like ATPase
MKYIEIAVGLPKNRGRLIPYAELISYLDANKPLYRSTYIYNADAVKTQNETKKATLANYFGVRSIDNILVDIDRDNNTDEHTLNKLIGVIHELLDMGVPETAMRPYFSGSGYHLLLHGDLFGFPESDELPYMVKETMKSILKHIDYSIYMRSGIYRVAHTLNQKTGLYKIPLSLSEVFNLDYKHIHALAKHPRYDFPYDDHAFEADGELADRVVTTVEQVRSYKAVNEPTAMATCVHKLFSAGPVEGKRHNTILRIASHFKRHGIPSDATKASLLHWNQNQLNEQDVIGKVENVYNAGYKYGCNDSLLKEHCDTKCQYYKRKDYLVDIKTASDLQKSLSTRLSTNFDGRKIDLGDLYGLDPLLDVEIFPSELVTIFGPTGSNKSTLAQNLALGYSPMRDELVSDYHIPTLYLSLELPDWYYHRRNLQIVADVDKIYVNKHYNELYEKYKDQLSHITVQNIAPTIPQIKEKIQELQPAVVYVDYIDQIETPYRDEYSQVKYISHQLRGIATNMDLIIVQISQVSRQYSREEILDLYAGKGSGAIENASSKVMGINAPNEHGVKELEMFKNTDGDCFTTPLIWTPSWRMKRPVT